MTLAYRLMRLGSRAGALVPGRVMAALGRAMGRLGMRADRRHRRIVRRNLRRAFPERDERWVEETMRRCFEHLGQVAAELPRLLWAPPGEIIGRTRHHGLENVLWPLARGRGVILLSGHFGNWEWASVATGMLLEVRGYVVVRPLDWAPADMLVSDWRTRGGHVLVPKERSARTLLGVLKQGGVVGVLLDQNVDWYEGVWVEFFGHRACTNKGAALLAMATGAAVVPYYNFRAPDGVFDIYFGTPLPTVRTASKLHDVWVNTQLYTRVLEQVVRMNPSQWLWMHQRWKTPPAQPWPRRKR